MKLLRTIRLDPSDTFIFDPPAEPGEWAVSGAFAAGSTAVATLPSVSVARSTSGAEDAGSRVISKRSSRESSRPSTG